MNLTNDNLPEYVESALKGILRGLEGVVTVMEYHERCDCEAPDRGYRLAIIQTKRNGEFDTGYYLNMPNSGNNFPRADLIRARNYFVGHVCDPSRCYR